MSLVISIGAIPEGNVKEFPKALSAANEPARVAVVRNPEIHLRKYMKN